MEPKSSASRGLTETAAGSPTVQAWELGLRLRERREELGMTAVVVGPCHRHRPGIRVREWRLAE